MTNIAHMHIGTCDEGAIGNHINHIYSIVWVVTWRDIDDICTFFCPLVANKYCISEKICAYYYLITIQYC